MMKRLRRISKHYIDGLNGTTITSYVENLELLQFLENIFSATAQKERK